jgi:hypothetical protein
MLKSIYAGKAPVFALVNCLLQKCSNCYSQKWRKLQMYSAKVLLLK